MLGGWQGTFCAGISTHNIERGVQGVDCCKRTLFSYFVQSVLSLIVRNGILSQIKISVIEARITCIL
jgi:hypothetical protein